MVNSVRKTEEDYEIVANGRVFHLSIDISKKYGVKATLQMIVEGRPEMIFCDMNLGSIRDVHNALGQAIPIVDKEVNGLEAVIPE